MSRTSELWIVSHLPFPSSFLSHIQLPNSWEMCLYFFSGLQCHELISGLLHDISELLLSLRPSFPITFYPKLLEDAPPLYILILTFPLKKIFNIFSGPQNKAQIPCFVIKFLYHIDPILSQPHFFKGFLHTFCVSVELDSIVPWNMNFGIKSGHNWIHLYMLLEMNMDGLLNPHLLQFLSSLK